MPTWTCATHGPVPAGEIRHLDHNSPTGQERHECGSSAGLDWTTDPKEPDMTLVVNTEQQALAMRRHTTAADYVFTRLGYRYRTTGTTTSSEEQGNG